MVKLTWKDFQKTLSKFALTKQDSQDFNDVTLVADDNYQVHVSKVMLCSSSLFFKRILIQNQDAHPVLFLEGVSNKDLDNIVGFIYKGEIKVCEKYLANLMSVSEDLQITGILEAFVAEQDQSTIKQDIETVTNDSANNFSFEEKNRSEDMAIRKESVKSQTAYNSLLEDIKVEAFDKYENIHNKQNDPLLLKQIRSITKKSKLNKYSRLTKSPKPLNEYIRKEVHVESEENVDSADADTDMTDIPEFWEYIGKCSFNYRMKFGTETYNKCLVCSKKIGNDNKILARHWRRYHLENHVKSSVTVNVNSVERNNGHAKNQNIQQGIIDDCVKNPSKKPLYEISEHSNITSDIPIYWDETNGKSQKDGDKYKCKICGSLVKRERKMLEKHWRKYHSEAVEDQVIIVKEGENPDTVIASLMEITFVKNGGLRATCTICGLNLPKSDLVRHIDSYHLSGATYKCGDCNKVFKRKRAQETHLKTCIEHIANKAPERVKVQMTDFDFKQKMKSMVGRNESEYICKVCGVSKITDSSIRHHIEYIHMEVDHPCKLCDSRLWFKSRKSLHNHIKIKHK